MVRPQKKEIGEMSSMTTDQHLEQALLVVAEQEDELVRWHEYYSRVEGRIVRAPVYRDEAGRETVGRAV